MCRMCCVAAAVFNSFVLDSSASLMPHVWDCLMCEHCPLLILFYRKQCGQPLQHQFETCTFLFLFSLLSPFVLEAERRTHAERSVWRKNNWLIRREENNPLQGSSIYCASVLAALLLLWTWNKPWKNCLHLESLAVLQLLKRLAVGECVGGCKNHRSFPAN